MQQLPEIILFTKYINDLHILDFKFYIIMILIISNIYFEDITVIVELGTADWALV